MSHYTYFGNDKHFMRCLINSEWSWSAIECDSSKTLDEQAQWYQTQSKTTLTNLIFENKIVDADRNRN